MKFTERKVNAPLEILYNDHFVGMPCMVTGADVMTDSEGKKIVKAGTIYPKNDATAKGVLLHDTDVTNGDAPGTIVVHGFIDYEKIIKNGIKPVDETILALKLIVFVGYDKGGK